MAATSRAQVKRVALTGGIATGKTHVRRQFEQLGVPTIDADVLARQAVAPGTPGLNAVVRHFGSEVLDSSGALDRHKLAGTVFSDPDSRLVLEGIVHPYVRTAMAEWFAGLDDRQHSFAIADIPLLFEVKREPAFDAVIVVACDPETQVKRVMKRDDSTETEARQRLASQLPIDQKVRAADYVIRTDGTVEETNRQVAEVWQMLHQRFG